MRVAYTLEQCWHDVPGGTAVAALRVAEAMGAHDDIRLIGVAGRHRHLPPDPWTPTIPVAHLPIAAPWLYETWLRFGWPKVERATGHVDVADATGLVPCATDAPLIVTLHDSAFLHEPAHFTKHGVRLFKDSVAHIRRHAALVLCSSQATMDDCFFAGLDGERLRLVPLGVEVDPATESEVQLVRRLYDLPSQYLLFVGTLEPRKNLRGLAAAVSLLDDELSLIVVGAEGWGDVDIEPSDADIRFLGFVPAEHLSAVYAGAEVFCYPSEREGYGLPVLEAMAQGVPVVTSSGTATEETAGNVAVLVEPKDPDDIARGITEALGRRAELSAKGVARAHKRSWASTAALTANAYREWRNDPGAGTIEAVSPRVAVNLMWCVPGDVGGSEQYLVRQLLGLAEVGAAHDVVMFGPHALSAAHPRLGAAFPLVAAPVDGRRRWRRIYAESTWLHRHTATAGLVHHGGGTAPTRARRPYVLTIHDLQHRTFPHYVHPLKRAYLDAVVPRSARHAAVVAVPSEYVRRTVVEQLAVDASRVVVVPHGYEPALLDDVTPEDELRARYSLGDAPVIVYPAMTAPHKNHGFLFDLLLDEWSATPYRLVLIGGRGAAAAEVAARLDDPRLRDRVVHAGRVSDADRNGLIALADALVFPSSYEGFGAPLIEAMALGTPIVCSDATCLPDVVGDAGLVLPLSRDAWRQSLGEADRQRDRLIAAGRERAATFTAAESGRALAAVYDMVLG